MKKISFIAVSLLLLLGVGFNKSSACINLDINIGTIDSVEGRLFAEIISTFIHERTGTKSIIKFYPNREELHAAIAESKIELIVANIVETIVANGLVVGPDVEANFAVAKQIYKKDMALVLLRPFGVVSDVGAGHDSNSPALAKIVLEKFPALPRLLKKLAGKIDADTTSSLLASVNEKGEKPKRVAKDFLVAKRLI